MAKKRAKTSKEYEDLGRMLVNIYESGYKDANTTYKNSFLKGLMGGVGGVIGATVVIALLIWFLSLFDEVPLIGDFIDKITNTIENK
jgi:hypothetical protein